MPHEIDSWYVGISIHTPTKGATVNIPINAIFIAFQSTLPRRERPVRLKSARTCICYFNPHSHEGSDFRCFDCVTTICKFQSTLPRRERRIVLYILSLRIYFNPHSHEGSDRSGTIVNFGNTISIHTPTKGATR